LGGLFVLVVTAVLRAAKVVGKKDGDVAYYRRSPVVVSQSGIGSTQDHVAWSYVDQRHTVVHGNYGF
jgi:hypothetical protein